MGISKGSLVMLCPGEMDKQMCEEPGELLVDPHRFQGGATALDG